MLQKQAVEPSTFTILERLMSIPELANYTLVGGTALALYYGHRISVDLDLFSIEKIEKERITDSLTQNFGDRFAYELDHFSPSIFCFIGNVKVDIVNYPHALISPTIHIEGIRMYGIPDIAAMKINAVLGRGAKKDFYDIYEILKHYSLKQIIEWYYEKYHKQVIAISIPQALIYFDDAELSEDPVSLDNINWEEVKESIKNSVRTFLT
jgi:predicted nucleotidyltransferase component of viral defense system